MIDGMTIRSTDPWQKPLNDRPRSSIGSLSAIRCGESPQVLLLHGVGLRADAWGAQIDALAHRYSLLAPDLPGHGHSPHPSQSLSLDDYVDVIASLIEQPIVIVGHSMGALIALMLAARWPDKARAVVALNTVFQRSESARQAVRQRAAELDGESAVDSEATLQRWFPDSAYGAERHACKQWLNEAPIAGYRNAYRCFAESDGPTESALASIAVPTLLMTGSDDHNSTATMSQAIADRVPNGTAQIIDSARHMLPMTHPQPVNAALLDLLGQQP
ncbi:alpha/beta hydrolase [Gammaproteobacteria bacterium]|nr:alpha/beta hydrolase [Gammaproteobacteria bacterium]